MKMQIQQANNGNTLICALCTIVIVSLIAANVLISSANHYNVTAKQLKGWKEALYAAEAGADAGFDVVRKLVHDSNAFATNGWSSVASPTPGPAWSKTFPSFGQANSLLTTVTVDRLDNAAITGTGNHFYRIRAIGTARVFGLPRVGMSDQYFAGGPNFAANSSTRGVGDTLLRKIDFKYDHFKATYGDGDGNSPTLSPVPTPQVTRRIELVAVPKFFVFGGALRVTTAFFGPGSAGVIDSYNSANPTNQHPSTPKVVNNDIPGANTTSYYGSNPTNTNYPELTPSQFSSVLADAHDGDVSVGTPSFAENGPIWGDVTTNGGNVTHSGYQISGTIDNNVPFTVDGLPAPPDYLANPSSYATGSASIPASGADQNNATTYVYSSISSPVTITNGNAGTSSPYAYAKIMINGDIDSSGLGGSTPLITVEKGVTAQIYFTGSMSLKGSDLVNQNSDHQSTTVTTTTTVLGVPVTSTSTVADTDPSRVGHFQFYGISPGSLGGAPSGTRQTINIDSPGNIYATFYAPKADITITGNPDIFSAIVGKSFTGNGGGGGNTSFHYDKALNQVNIGLVTDYSIASYVEDVR
jgi:hypothetical protein